MDYNTYDIPHIRRQFPALSRMVQGKPLVYLDNCATSQTPACVVEEIVADYYERKANVHRGVHTLSQEATMRQEATRERVRGYIGARSVQEIVFTRGTTEAINLVASSFGDRFREGDEVILTVMEHHSNIVPWQLLQRTKGIRLRVVGCDERGVLDLEQYRSLFNERTVFASFAQVSNVLGTVNPVAEMIRIAHGHGVPVLVDGAQAAPHMKVNVRELDADFYVFSSHKMYGPTGIGVLYGRRELLEEMPPYQGGGEMIGHVSFEGTTFAELPFKFEAGTPDFIGIAAFSKALDFIESVGIEAIGAHEEMLMRHTTERLKSDNDGLRIYGEAPEKGGLISFLIDGTHPYDIGMLLDGCGVAVRTGHHCAQPLMERYGIPGTVRVSFGAYNTVAECDYFADSLRKVAAMLR